MGVKERRERERQARRKAVLDAARTLVRERGFNGTTTREIAKACELSEATLFFYFKSKDEIFTSLLFEGIDFMAEGLRAIQEGRGTSEAKLRKLWGFFAKVRQCHPEYFHVFASLAQPHATEGLTARLKEEIVRRSGENFRLLEALLRDLLGEQEVRLEADLIWAAFLGLVLLRDSRENLGAKAHPTSAELRKAFGLLASGITPAEQPHPVTPVTGKSPKSSRAVRAKNGATASRRRVKQ